MSAYGFLNTCLFVKEIQNELVRVFKEAIKNFILILLLN
jgi:hypothetical protein